MYISWNIYVSHFIVRAAPLKSIDLLHHTNVSYFMQHVSSNLFRTCVLHLKSHAYIAPLTFWNLSMAIQQYQGTGINGSWSGLYT